VIRLLVVDDHPMLRTGVCAALEGTQITVVAEAGTAADAVREAVLVRPDVVLMDLGLPDRSGIEATREVLAALPDTAVLAFTMSQDEESVFAALRAGALGYLVKGAPREELITAIEVVGSGQALLLGPTVARRVQAHFAGLAEPSAADRVRPAAPDTVASPADDPAFGALTAREREVLELMASGWGNQAIASRLFLAPKTVRNHVSTIIGKLQASDRGEAVVRARRRGFGGS
jgi:DNA-binding NarL/FixJ family response regulator